MKTDKRGGDAASNLEARLAGRFAGELEQAERDYADSAPARRLREEAGPGRSPSLWSRVALPAVGLTAIAAVALVGLGIALGPMTTGPAGSGEPSSGTSVAGTQTAAASVQPSASTSIGPVESANVPASIGGQTVYRVGNLPAMKLGSTFLLGGVLARDTSCVPPSPYTVLAPPSCGYWTVGGVKLGTVAGVLNDSLLGRPIVVQVMMSRVIVDCFAPCPPSTFLYATRVVWQDGVAVP